MTIEKQLADALRIIAAHEVAGPLTQNDDNVSLSDLPFYVAGKAHAELGILHNIARNALDAYEARPSVTGQPRFFIDHGQIHDRVTGKHVTTDEDTVFCDGINHCLALLNELAALPVQDEQKIGPRPHVLVCKGCPAYETEAWRDPSGDGETYDNGQYAWCNAAGRKSMGAYHYDHNAAPQWCPARPLPASPSTAKEPK